MLRRIAILAATLLLATLSVGAATGASADSAETRRLTGTVKGVPFVVRVPPNWNGDLLLWSHPYTLPGGAPTLPETDADHPQLTQWLLDHGYALAGADYPSVPLPTSAMVDAQVGVVDWFAAHVGRPRHVIAWGKSLGGALTAVLAERRPDRIDAALPMCGDLAGEVAGYNARLDVAYAEKTLLFGDAPIALVRVDDPAANHERANGLLRAALDTAQGRARLALANAFGPVPGWVDSLQYPRPADPEEQVLHQYLYDRYQLGAFLFGAGRAELEAAVGGNPSWNAGVDYQAQLAKSSQRELVATLYRTAGLDLDADLARLNRGTRITPDPKAVARLARQSSLTGRLSQPTLTLHSTGDGAAPVEVQRWYADRVAAQERGHLLRQAYVARGNHCFFTAGEQLAVLRALFHRLDADEWGEVSPAALNAIADSYGADFRTMWSYYSPGTAVVDNAFLALRPGPFLRPFPG